MFLFISFLRDSIWYLGICRAWYFGSSGFVIDWVSKLLLYNELLRVKKRLMTREVQHFMSSSPFSDPKTSQLCFQIGFLKTKNWNPLGNIITWCLFMLSRSPLSSFTMHSQRNLINSFGSDWGKRSYIFKKRLEHIKSRMIMCVCQPRILIASTVRRYKFLKKGNPWLYNYVIDRDDKQINKWPDRREETLRLDTS